MRGKRAPTESRNRRTQESAPPPMPLRARQEASRSRRIGYCPTPTAEIASILHGPRARSREISTCSRQREYQHFGESLVQFSDSTRWGQRWQISLRFAFSGTESVPGSTAPWTRMASSASSARISNRIVSPSSKTLVSRVSGFVTTCGADHSTSTMRCKGNFELKRAATAPISSSQSPGRSFWLFPRGAVNHPDPPPSGMSVRQNPKCSDQSADATGSSLPVSWK